MAGMGVAQPTKIISKDEGLRVSDLPGVTNRDSFQMRLKQIIVKAGIGILREPEQVIKLLEKADIDLKTRNVFRIILLTDAVEYFVSYAKEQVMEYELVEECTSLLRDEWGMSKEAFMPVIKQMLNAIDKAMKVRTESVGKSICNQLKEMRRQFAQANQIDYYEEECIETKPCDGTCPYCEERTKYLVEKAREIAKIRDVVYPQIPENEIQRKHLSSEGHFSTGKTSVELYPEPLGRA